MAINNPMMQPGPILGGYAGGGLVGASPGQPNTMAQAQAAQPSMPPVMASGATPYTSPGMAAPPMSPGGQSPSFNPQAMAAFQAMMQPGGASQGAQLSPGGPQGAAPSNGLADALQSYGSPPMSQQLPSGVPGTAPPQFQSLGAMAGWDRAQHAAGLPELGAFFNHGWTPGEVQGVQQSLQSGTPFNPYARS